MVRKHNKGTIPIPKKTVKVPVGVAKLLAAMMEKGKQFKSIRTKPRHQGEREMARRRRHMAAGWYKADRFVDGKWIRVDMASKFKI